MPDGIDAVQLSEVLFRLAVIMQFPSLSVSPGKAMSHILWPHKSGLLVFQRRPCHMPDASIQNPFPMSIPTQYLLMPHYNFSSQCQSQSNMYWPDCTCSCKAVSQNPYHSVVVRFQGHTQTGTIPRESLMAHPAPMKTTSNTHGAKRIPLAHAQCRLSVSPNSICTGLTAHARVTQYHTCITQLFFSTDNTQTGAIPCKSLIAHTAPKKQHPTLMGLRGSP